MANAQPTFDTAVLKTIGDIVSKHAGINSARSDENKDIQAEKVGQYARLTAQIWTLPVAKGKLSRQNRKAVGEALAHYGNVDIDKGVGKRLYDGAVALSAQRKKHLKHGDQSPPATVNESWIEARLHENGLTSEAKIKAALFPNGTADAVQQVVNKFVGSLTYSKDDDGNRVPNNVRTGNNAEEFDALISALHEQKRIFDAVQEGAAKGIAEAETLAKVLGQVE